jgi:hypothetical protein
MRVSPRIRTLARLSLWALVALAAHAGATQVAALGPGAAPDTPAPDAAPASRCAGAACAALAWPYRPQDGGEAAPASRPPRPVRIIALDAPPAAR